MLNKELINIPKCKECGKETDLECPNCHRPYCEAHLMPENHPHCKVKVKKRSEGGGLPIFVILPIIMLVIGLVILLFSIDLPSLVNPKPHTIYVTQTVNETIPLELNFEHYFYNETYHDTRITLTGFLTRLTVGTGFIAYIVDDHDNEISIAFQNDDQIEIFDNSKKNDIYEIKGMLRKKHMGLFIEPIYIRLSKRPVKIEQKNITVAQDLI